MKLKLLLKVGLDIRVFLKGHSDILTGRITEAGDDYLVISENGAGNKHNHLI